MYEHHTLLLLKKAVDQPDDLTDAEIAELDSFFELAWNMWASQIAMGRHGLNDGTVDMAATDLAWYMQSQVGRNWVFANRSWMSVEPELLAALLARFEETPLPTKFVYIQTLKASP